MENIKFKLSNEDALHIDELKFIFSESEKKLASVIDSGDIAVNRTVIVLGVLFTMLGAVVSYLFNDMSKGDYTLYSGAASLVGLYLFFLCFYTAKNIKGHDYFNVGTEPCLLAHDYYIQTYEEKLRREKAYYLKLLNDHQERIDKNKATNEIKWRRYRNMLNAAMLTPVVTGIALFIAYIAS